MLSAEDISRKAVEVRKQGGNFEALQAVVEDWSRRLFWQQDSDAQAAFLEKALVTDPALQVELADALEWDQPKSDSPALTLLALDAARDKKNPQPGPEVFKEEKDWNWEQWRKEPDLRRLQALFDNNSKVRNAFSRAVNAYPGRRHLREIATLAVNEMRKSDAKTPAVLQRHLLNWESFRAGLQDSQFLIALAQEYEFRESVARAINFQSSEAKELAASAVDMWRAVPINCLRSATRKELLSQLDDLLRRREDEVCERSSEAELDEAGQAALEEVKESLEALKQVREVFQPSSEEEPNDAEWDALEETLADLFSRNLMLACDLWKAMNWPRSFALVLREELRQIEARRQHSSFAGGNPGKHLAFKALDVSDLAAHKKLFAVAFSGGGIRSATFNLGVLQKLSEFGLLGKADYLSTVSGGGYIGTWLAGWIKKNGALPFQTFLPQQENLLSPKIPDPRAETQRPVRFLREFSNYLTPQLSSLSFDIWTMAAIYTRNVILNQAILVSILGTILLVPRLLVFPMKYSMPDLWMLWIAGVTLVVAVFCMSLNMRHAVSATLGPPGRFAQWLLPLVPDWVYDAGSIQVLVVGNMLLAVYCGSLWMWRNLALLEPMSRPVLISILVAAAGLSLLLSGLGGFVHQFRIRQAGARWWPLVLLMITLLVSGATLGLLRLYILVLAALQGLCGNVWHAVVWGPIMLLAVLIIPGTLQVGLMGVDFPDPGREWLSRFRAVCSVNAVYWIGLTGVGIYGPLLVLSVAHAAKVWISGGLTLGWVITTIGGIFAGNSKKTGTDKEGNPAFSSMQVLAKVGPPVFVLGLILLIATAEQLLLAHGRNGRSSYDLATLIKCHWTLLEPWHMWDVGGWWLDKTGWLFLALAIAGGILAWRVDINEFSMHHFYKNRLVRCYLGASNKNRRPNPFTGFDGRDDLHMSRLKTIVEPPDSHDSHSKIVVEPLETPYLGPYPILNATLNLSVGKQLAWQERKGASFIFTPCFCGFDVEGWSNTTGAKAGRVEPSKAKCSFLDALKPYGYRETETYTQRRGPLLGTAMSISGAAANPNQGYNTSPAVSFLMTMFDVRLGWWLGNPRRDATSKLASPRFGLAALLSELLGMTDDETRFVNLSDGGHFDNMGLYELVRRRCGFILLCDAEQDGDYKFEGLGSAIRKCRVDFGALIEIDTTHIKPQGDPGLSESHCAVGKIHYLDGSEGTLVYIKASLTGDEPEDVVQYHAAKPHFPHETTADQWFGESQFESYRALGYHALDHSLGPATAWVEWDSQRPDVPKLFEALAKYWYPINPNLKDTASKHTLTLSDLLDRIRRNSNLHALGAELFPGGSVVSAGGARVATEEFYFSMCIIQLMEDIYFDLQLDQKVRFHDPRIGGWKFLFETWKSVPAVAAAWAAERDTFRKDFQLFWRSL